MDMTVHLDVRDGQSKRYEAIIHIFLQGLCGDILNHHHHHPPHRRVVSSRLYGQGRAAGARASGAQKPRQEGGEEMPV